MNTYDDLRKAAEGAKVQKLAGTVNYVVAWERFHFLANPATILQLLADLDEARVDAERLAEALRDTQLAMPVLETVLKKGGLAGDDVAKQMFEQSQAALHASDALRSTANEVATLLETPRHQIICPKCGADRAKEPCKNWRKHECAMVGTAQSTAIDNLKGK